MSRRLSFNQRNNVEGLSEDQIELVLIEISHDDLESPIRLSTDNTERLSSDPLMYGTRSDWGGANPLTEPFLFVVASCVLPGDAEDAPASSTMVLTNLDDSIPAVLRSFKEPAEFNFAVTTAAEPNVIQAEWSGLLLTSAEITSGEISLSVSREEIELEKFPWGRMSKLRFPGMHR